MIFLYEYESLYPDLHKKAMYFGVEFFHAAIVAMLGAVSILSGLISGNWFLMGITVFYYSMMVKINDRRGFMI